MTTDRILSPSPSIWLAISLLFVACAPAEKSDSKAELQNLLTEFMAGVDQRATHDAFWAEDLIYTSSNGTRFGKAEILAGFDGDDAEPAAVAYRAEDVDIRVLGDTAIVAFRLVGEPTDADIVLNYLNTGTFAFRDGRWQVVAWQATKIPEPE